MATQSTVSVKLTGNASDLLAAFAAADAGAGKTADGIKRKFAEANLQLDASAKSSDSLLTKLANLGQTVTGLSSITSMMDRFRGSTAGAASSMQQAQQSGGGLLKMIAPLAPALLGVGAAGAAVGVGLVGTFAAAGAGLGAFALAAKPVVASLNTAATAQQHYNSVVAQYGASSSQAKTALAQMQMAMAQLSPAEQQAAANLSNFKSAYQTWSQSLDPQILPVFNNGLAIAQQMLKNLTPVVQGAGNALAKVSAEIKQTLSSGSVVSGFQAFGGQVQQAIGSLGPLLANVVPAALNLFQAMNPLMGIVEKFLTSIGPQLPALASSLNAPFAAL